MKLEAMKEEFMSRCLLKSRGEDRLHSAYVMNSRTVTSVADSKSKNIKHEEAQAGHDNWLLAASRLLVKLEAC